MPNGWRLSPAFDINPNIDKAEHALNLDIGDNRANLESVIATAQYYELTQDQAVQIVNEILSVTRTWEAVAKNLAISRGDIELMRAAFQS
jgi:serine/threonine-protein kinase HipA